MRLWRLSTRPHAEALDGGYGLFFDGRWNTIGRPVTYAATSPSLCVLEKLLHVEDPTLLPELAMVSYEMRDDLPAERRELTHLPRDWRRQEMLTHAAIHGAYHRGEVGRILRQISAALPWDTFAVFLHQTEPERRNARAMR